MFVLIAFIVPFYYIFPQPQDINRQKNVIISVLYIQKNTSLSQCPTVKQRCVFFSDFIYFYNNWLHYCAWHNSFPNELEDLPTYLYFLRYDLTYSVSWIFRYVFPAVGMMAACLGIEVYRAKVKKFEELEQRQLDEL